MIQPRREKVELMANAMERELRKHDSIRGEDGWVDDDPLTLLQRAREELDELEQAVLTLYVASGNTPEELADLNRQVRSEAADLANFAMMVADASGSLDGWGEHH